MTERPIIFSAPMVQALLEGRKKQTRRIIKRPAALNALSVFGPSMLLNPGCADLLPFAVGDVLWVRETWGLGLSDHGPCPRYRATLDYQCGDKIKSPHEGPFKWKPSIHMPRKFSRITLRVTEVRVQRLQDISFDDARAEGVTEGMGTENFRKLWETIHGSGAWDANPWVAAITFERVNQ